MAEAARNEEKGDDRVAIPVADIYESERAFTIVIDLPGCDETSTEIEIGEGQLTLSARVIEPREEDVGLLRLGHREFVHASYRRIFTFPELVDADRIDGTMRNGLLRIVLPKLERTIPRRFSPRREE